MMVTSDRLITVPRAQAQPASSGATPEIVSKTNDLSLRFKAALRRLTDADDAYWDYAAVKSNSNPDAYFQYPAMMVPRMQGEIIRTVRQVFPSTSRTFDPFAGSGTILTESLKQGLSTIATDVNPMALLLCKVKSQPFKVPEVRLALEEVLLIAQGDLSDIIELEYENRAKWFNGESLKHLSRVRRAIMLQDDIEVRRVLWVAFAEAVRITSNTRTTTYKLHMRDAADVARRTIGVPGRIAASMTRVVSLYEANFVSLEEAGLLKGKRFGKTATVFSHDIRKPLHWRQADLLISSPPYGDNHTTVTYGQHSFLPLSWIPFGDIDEGLDASLVCNTHAIDSASLGGKRENLTAKRSAIASRSVALERLLEVPQIKSKEEACRRLVSFFHDLDLSFSNAIKVLQPESPIVLTLGNRCVRGVRVPTDTIVKELLATRHCEFIDTHARAIPTKRMAHRNQSAGTMLTETLLVMRAPRK